MVKLMMVAIAAALLFSAGLFAGQSVLFTRALATGTTETSNPRLTAKQKTAIDHPWNSTILSDSAPISFVSHATALENTELLTAELTEQGDSGNAHRTAIRNLIHEHFPNTDASVSDVWVESYAEMSLDEIAFILEQKRRVSNGNESGLSVSSVPSVASLPHSGLKASLPSRVKQETDIAVRIVETNLRSAYSLGFRRMVVLPDEIGDIAEWTPDKRCSAPMTRFRSFESGTLIGSPIATHVALTKETSTLFCLEGNQLTRRGDFQMLADRRLGIITRGEEMASVESTPLPTDASDVQISRNGTIQYKNAAGVAAAAGRIAVCRVLDLADLQSDDGVFFTASDAEKVTRCDNVCGLLLTNTLEQSNVDHAYEHSLLDHLKSLSDSSVE